MADTWDYEVELRADPATAEARAAILANPGFGRNFTDHMVLAHWNADRGWHDQKVTAYAPFKVSPAAAVLHYAQEIFEGLKAFRHADGSVWSFRPEANAERFTASARRLALPELPEGEFVASLRALVQVDEAWVPSTDESSLYLRPFMFASEPNLAVRPSREVTYGVIASPAGPYFEAGVKPVNIWLSKTYIRAAPGGTGEAKTGGNYAASLIAQAEALAHGCEQVIFLDAVERKWLEEFGSMLLFLVYKDGRIVTPELSGTILHGITRASIIELAKELGHDVEERRVSIDEWRDGVLAGDITEVFATGTAAVVTPIGRLVSDDDVLHISEEPGPVTSSLRRTLLDLQYGRTEDTRGWLTRLA